MLRNAVFQVKGVPLLYTPFLYYPTKRDDRATGILLPTYGATSLRGQAIHNAFFWAIDRSQDATFLYDWYSNAGQGVGSEYRYNFGAGSNGNFKTYWLDQKATTDELGGGAATPAAATSCAARPTRACRAGFAPGRTSTTSPASPRCRP